MAGFKKFGALTAAAQAAKRYAQQNPDKTDRYLGKAAEFANRRTKGKYSRQIDGLSTKARGATRGQNRPVAGDDETTGERPA